jgi:hypothetical protein
VDSSRCARLVIGYWARSQKVRRKLVRAIRGSLSGHKSVASSGLSILTIRQNRVQGGTLFTSGRHKHRFQQTHLIESFVCVGAHQVIGIIQVPIEQTGGGHGGDLAQGISGARACPFMITR